MTPQNRKRRPARRSATPEEIRRYGILGCHELGLLPPIGGGETAAATAPSTLEETLASLEASLKSIEEPEATPAESEETPAAEPSAEQKALDQRQAELDAYADRLAESAKSLEATIAKVKAHGGSRFVGEGADPEVAEHVAKGGTVERGTGLVIAEPASVRAGEHQGVKSLTESKSVLRFFAAIKALRDGDASDAERQWILRQKALAEQTNTAGGYLIPPDWMPGILQLFRGVTVVRRARPGRIVPFTAQMNQVALTGGATAYYTAENAAIPTSQETFNQITLLTPHNLTGLVPASNWLLQDTRRTDVPNQVNVDAEAAIRQDLAVVMALKEDKNFLFGNPGTETGSPTGLVNISGIVTNPLAVPANGFQPTLPQLRALKNYVRRFNVPNARWTWFLHSEFISYVEGLTDSLGRFLADAPNLLQVNDDDNSGSNTDPASSGSIVGAGAGFSGRLLNLPFFASNQIPVNLTQGTATNATWILLVDMNQLVVGLNQDLVIETSSDASYTPDGGTTWVSSFQSNQTLFKATLRHDINHLYPNLGIVQQSGILVS
jgi:HK97 family phage major capsid protein